MRCFPPPQRKGVGARSVQDSNNSQDGFFLCVRPQHILGRGPTRWVARHGRVKFLYRGLEKPTLLKKKTPRLFLFPDLRHVSPVLAPNDLH